MKVVKRKTSWRCPRTGREYTDQEIKGKRFMPNGLHVKYLEPINGERVISKSNKVEDVKNDGVANGKTGVKKGDKKDKKTKK